MENTYYMQLVLAYYSGSNILFDHIKKALI